MRILSEDNRYMTTSILMSRFFNIEYTGGNSGLRVFTKDRESKGLVIFLDVVPDNHSTLGLYRAMRSDIIRNGLSGKVFLYPIICTEYYVLLALWDMGIRLNYQFPWMSEVENAVKEKKTILEYIPRGICDYKESFRSFEKQCKLLLNNSGMEFHNVNMSNPDIRNQYLKKSYYLNDDEISTYDKAMNIAIKLPALVIEPGVSLQKGPDMIDDLVRYCEEYQACVDRWLRSDISKSLGDCWWERYLEKI